MEDEMGMSDLQFKSFLKRVVADLKRALDAPTKEEADKILDTLITDLQGDIES